MSGKEKILDDVARIAGGAVNILSGVQNQIREEVKTHIEDTASRLDLVPREDFEKLEAMLIKAREEQESLSKRVSELEQQLNKKKK